MAKVIQIKTPTEERIKLTVDEKEISIMVKKRDGMVFVSVEADKDVKISHEVEVFGKWWGKEFTKNKTHVEQ